MAKFQVQVEVEKEVYDLGVLLGKVLKAAIKDKKSVAMIASSELGDLIQFLGEIQALPADIKDGLAESIEGAVLGLKDGFLPPVAAV